MPSSTDNTGGDASFFPHVDDKRLMRFYSDCTLRKKEIIELTAAGMSNDKIGKVLFLSKRSVADHLTDIYAALSALEELAGIYPDRSLLISLFAPFFDRHPEMRNTFAV